MSGTTSVPAPSFGPTGFIVPAESDILAGVQADLNAAFGGNLNPALETPGGQIASTLTAIIGDKNDKFLLLSNNVDPAFASGRMQDGIARIYFLTRKPAQPTSVTATIVGRVGVVIPTGALAKATDGNIYICTVGGTIPSTGTMTLPFACTVTGPIACPAGSLTTIYQTVNGWDTINNLADGVLGNVVESRAAFESRRQQSVAINSRNTLAAIKASVLQLAGVLDVYATENSTGTAATIGGVSIAARSMFVSVAGGDPQAIAQEIWSKKSPGCGYTGNTTRTVTDTVGYSIPYPAYSVTFQTAASTPILFAVSIANSTLVPSNATALIQAAIIAAFAGADGGPRAQIGSTIFASRFYGPIAALGSWAQISQILLGTTAATLLSTTLSIDKVPTISAGNITVTLV